LAGLGAIPDFSGLFFEPFTHCSGTYAGFYGSDAVTIIIKEVAMNIFGIGLPEMAVILVIALLVFGPKKLPEIGRSLGKTLKSFQDASKEFEAEIKRGAEQAEASTESVMEARLEDREPAQLTQVESAQPVQKTSPVETAPQHNV
jgi:sec-independent protein translocase protein TatA